MRLFIAIPALDELDFLPQTMQALAHQQGRHHFEVSICVNQPESWWENSEKRTVCQHNQTLLKWLRSQQFPFPLHLIDKSSKGKGWDDKNFGVGFARKVLFEKIVCQAADDDILISMDADTVFGPRYVESIAQNFERHRDQNVISVPYFHPLTHDDQANRAILRYEIYMRNCLLNLFRIGCPYSFTAIGSAIAVKIKALKKINGITPMKSGEDFYLLQKLRKMSPISNWNDELVYPAARFSDRVFFGTGPAIRKGSQGIWDSYPIYHFSLFDEVKKCYDLIDDLYQKDQHNKFIDFLEKQFKDDNLWQPLRKNAKDLVHFRHAFHEKADGLRIMQFLKSEQSQLSVSDEQSLRENLPFLTQRTIPPFIQQDFSFDQLSTAQLSEIRTFLFEEEMEQRKKH
ncbi:MAG: glycosyltransferase family 2 protein [Bacteroidales bacterium]|nr:glycosyltransferase family 2 protein [Bacteroidales bacterium]